MDREGRLTIDEIWAGLQIIGPVRSHANVEISVRESRAYVVERRKKLVPVQKLAQLFKYMGIMTHPDNLIALYTSEPESDTRAS